MSLPERLLWARLKVRQPDMPVFRRQHPIGPYVLDFYCVTARLAVEVDGWSHNMGTQPERDLRRDAWLRAQKIEVLRIPATDVLRSPDEAADGVRRTVAGHAPTTAVPAVPLPRSAGEEL